MNKKMPRINLGFFQDGLKINSKQFHPLNMSFGEFKIESDKEYKEINALELVEALSSIDSRDDSKTSKIRVLKDILSKVNL